MYTTAWLRRTFRGHTLDPATISDVFIDWIALSIMNQRAASPDLGGPTPTCSEFNPSPRSSVNARRSLPSTKYGNSYHIW